MSSPARDSHGTGSAPHQFATTRWSVVLAAGGVSPSAGEALAVLCRVYWYPLYAFVRRQGHSPADAQDLTQEFFARLLAKEWLGSVAPERGRFRSWLLAAMKHFLAKEWRDAHRQKRGGGKGLESLDAMEAEERYAREPVDLASAERLYDRRWAMDLLDRGLARLEAEFSKAGKAAQFAALKFCLSGEKVALRDVAEQLGSSEGAIKVAVHRLRERYRELIREEIAETVESPKEIEAELQELQAALRG
jgi:RNA polymerase sigma factor (sigma-70 family)